MSSSIGATGTKYANGIGGVDAATLNRISVKDRGSGNRKRLDAEDKEVMLKLRAAGVSVPEIARIFRVNKASAYTAFKRFDAEAQKGKGE